MAAASIRTSTTSSGSSSGPTIRAPRTTRASTASVPSWRRTSRRRSPTRSRRSSRPASRRTSRAHSVRRGSTSRAAPRSRSAIRVSSSSLAPGVSKGRAVRRVARSHGIPLGQVMAVGDQLNDLEMIAAVGHGVAMPTAPAEVQAVARYIAPPVEEEGAAQMIERLVLARGSDRPDHARTTMPAWPRRSRPFDPGWRRRHPDGHRLRHRRRPRYARRHRAAVRRQAASAGQGDRRPRRRARPGERPRGPVARRGRAGRGGLARWPASSWLSAPGPVSRPPSPPGPRPWACASDHRCRAGSPGVRPPADHVRQPLRRAGCPGRCGRDREHRRFRGPHRRWRPGPGTAPVHRRRLRSRAQISVSARSRPNGWPRRSMRAGGLGASR